MKRLVLLIGLMLAFGAPEGDRRGQWAITVNARWRICFEFSRGDAHNVEIVDYHKG